MLTVNSPMQRMGEYRDSLINWLKQSKNKLLLGSSYLVIGVLCFEAGWLQKSLVASESFEFTIETKTLQIAPQVEEIQLAVPPKTTDQVCRFIGSKKSNKYHHPQSRCAKQIKQENQICFSSVEAAQARHYVPGCLEL